MALGPFPTWNSLGTTFGPYDAKHVNEAVARIVQQYQGKPLFRGLISLLAGRMQSVEDAAILLLFYRWLATATSAQLDVIGKIVGQPRLGYGDAQYLIQIQSRILANNSSGTINDLYGVVTPILPILSDDGHGGFAPSTSSSIVEFQPAAFEYTVTADFMGDGLGVIGQALANLCSYFIRITRAAGVYGVFRWSPDIPGNCFSTATGPGMGLSNVGGGAGGGKLSSAIAS